MKFIFYAFDTVWLFCCTALSAGLLFSFCRFKGVLISRSFPQSESFKAFPHYVSAYFALRKGGFICSTFSGRLPVQNGQWYSLITNTGFISTKKKIKLVPIQPQGVPSLKSSSTLKIL